MVPTASPAQCTLILPVMQEVGNQNAPRPSVPPKKCPCCGGTDHSRRSSKKCRYFRKRVSQGAAAVAAAPINVAPPRVDAAVHTSTLQTTEVTRVELEEDDSNLSQPNFIKIKSKNEPSYKPVIDVSS